MHRLPLPLSHRGTWAYLCQIFTLCSILKHAIMPQKFKKTLLNVGAYLEINCMSPDPRLPEASLQPLHNHHHNEFRLFQTFNPMTTLHASLAQF